MNLTRRALLTGLVAFAAAPAIVRAESLMPVRTEIIRPSVGKFLRIRLPNDFIISDGPGLGLTSSGNSLLSINLITREAVRLFQNSNAFIQFINRDFEREFGYNDGINWHSPRAKNQITFAKWSRNAA